MQSSIIILKKMIILYQDIMTIFYILMNMNLSIFTSKNMIMNRSKSYIFIFMIISEKMFILFKKAK